MPPLKNEEYTVGWICALPLEMAAARLMLDQNHGKPLEQHRSDQNTYHLGSIGQHNIVIACLPAGVYGTTSAATVAMHMLATFESIRIGLMVGIGGGIPSKEYDIRLGDIVISRPEKTSGGVVQYDFGKTVAEGKFVRTGQLNKPPMVLLNAVANLQAEHELEGTRVPEILSQSLAKYKKMQVEYAYQGASNDTLYKADYEHKDNSDSCESCEPEKIVPRSERDTTEPEIHYGLIASGNQVIKHGALRDKLGKELGVICFEMEAAGLMDNFPCLVIRGICDYSDSHKNKRWQRYAAATAAGYAKELLSVIPASQISAAPNAVELLKTVHEQNKAILNVSQKIDLKFDLANIETVKGASFDSYQNQADAKCHPDTRLELRQRIQEWFDDPQGKRIFWLNGMAGTGKSTLSRTVAQTFKDNCQLGATFFFKKGEGDRSHGGKFFTTIAAQLHLRIPEMIPHIAKAVEADPLVSEKPMNEQFQKLIFQPLSEIRQDRPGNLKLAIIIDALDECESEGDISSVLHLLCQCERIEYPNLRIFLTSRPELPIRLGFQAMSLESHNDFALHEIPKYSIEHDIHAYLNDELANLKKKHNCFLPADHLLPYDWPGEERIQALVKMVTPLFIFAATICRFIGDHRWDPEDRLSRVLKYQISSQASNLDKTYLPILDQLISGLSKSEKDTLIHQFRVVVGSIVTLADSLSAQSLASLLQIPLRTVTYRLDSLHSVLNVPESQESPIRLLHLSFRDFLVDHDGRQSNPFWIDEKEAHKLLLTKCLHRLSMPDTLRQNICNLDSLGTLRSDIDLSTINECIPLDVQYACRYWVHHLERSQSLVYEGDEVHIFLSEHIIHWLEVLSLLGRLSESILLISTLQTLVDGEVPYWPLKSLIFEAKRLALKNQYICNLAPLQWYATALAFAPGHSQIKTSFPNRLTKWIKRLPIIEPIWSGIALALEGHSAPIKAVAFSSNSKLAASGSVDKTAKIWDVSTGVLLHTLKAHDGTVRSLVFSNDNTILATASSDCTVNIWNFHTGALLKTLTGHLKSVKSVEFLPEGKFVSAERRTIKIWDAKAGTLLNTLEGPFESAKKVIFSSDSKTVLSATRRTPIRSWDMATEKPLTTFNTPDGMRIEKLAFSSDCKIVAFQASPYDLGLWDLACGDKLNSFPGPAFDDRTIKLREISILAFTILPSGELLVLVQDSSIVKLMYAGTGRVQQLLENSAHRVGKAAALSKDGGLVAVGLTNETVALVESVSGGTLLLCEDFPESDAIKSLHFSRDKKTLASVLESGMVHMSSTSTGIRSHSLYLIGQDWCQDLIFSPDDSQVATSDSKCIRIWNSTTGALLQSVTVDWVLLVGMDFLQDGTMVPFGSDPVTIRTSDLSTGESTSRIIAGRIKAVAVSPDNTQIASIASDFGAALSARPQVKIWDAKTGRHQRSLEGDLSEVKAIAFSPNREIDDVIVAADPKVVRVFNPHTGKLSGVYEGYPGKPNVLKFSPDCMLIATGSEDGVLRLWDSVRDPSLETARAHQHQTSTVMIAPNGKVAASAGRHSEVKLWNLDTGALIRNLEGGDGYVRCLKFSHDSRIIMSASFGPIMCWSTATGEMIETDTTYPDTDSHFSVSPNSPVVAATSYYRRRIVLLNPISAQIIWQIEVESHLIRDLDPEFSPDGGFLAVGLEKEERYAYVMVCDANTGEVLKYLSLSSIAKRLKEIRWSSNSKLLAAAIISNHGITTVLLYEVNSGRLLKKFEANSVIPHGGPEYIHIYSLAISPDNQLLALAVHRLILIWEIPSGDVLQCIDSTMPVYRMSFSTRGPYLETNRGYLSIQPFYDGGFPSPPFNPRKVFVGDPWITCDGENILWLPHEYRTNVLDVHDNIFMFGDKSGGVTFMEFDLLS